MLITGFLGLTLSACGGDCSPAVLDGQSPNGATHTVNVSLTADIASTTGKAIGNNLVELSGGWPNWGGIDSGITYEATTDAQRIPGDGRAHPLSQGGCRTNKTRFDNWFSPS